ncbi:hypothetical protein XA68_12102 [Ophiocordyceps unilateralis]|uniref:Phospholipase/carboxylesterase/thioesterase domain-containing protein n=1 Tax=Ophiocordyceps unilateralis TaxID=268505 RepID=A0A2A9PDM7_OPHUN|nr:hypothetical protein XA68_12102 [Ophiocordyceps unilateralis]
MAAPACNRDSQSPVYVVSPSAAHTHTFILLHDVGSNGSEFGADLLRLGLTSTGRTLDQLFPGVRFVFPSAIFRSCNAINDHGISLWFNMASFGQPDFRPELQVEGLTSSALQMTDLIRYETSLVEARNIVIGGLGQGCAMSIDFLLGLNYSLGGFIGTNGYLPFGRNLENLTAEGSSEDNVDDNNNALTTARQGDGNSPDEPSVGLCVRVQRWVRYLMQICTPNIPRREETTVRTPIFLALNDGEAAASHLHGQRAATALQRDGYDVVWEYYPGPENGYEDPIQVDAMVDFIRSRVGLIPQI